MGRENPPSSLLVSVHEDLQIKWSANIKTKLIGLKMKLLTKEAEFKTQYLSE